MTIRRARRLAQRAFWRMALGTPVAATPVGRVPRAMHDGVNGLLIELDSGAKLAPSCGDPWRSRHAAGSGTTAGLPGGWRKSGRSTMIYCKAERVPRGDAARLVPCRPTKPPLALRERRKAGTAIAANEFRGSKDTRPDEMIPKGNATAMATMNDRIALRLGTPSSVNPRGRSPRETSARWLNGASPC